MIVVLYLSQNPSSSFVNKAIEIKVTVSDGNFKFFGLSGLGLIPGYTYKFVYPDETYSGHNLGIYQDTERTKLAKGFNSQTKMYKIPSNQTQPVFWKCENHQGMTGQINMMI